jgi:hypothetical protein
MSLPASQPGRLDFEDVLNQCFEGLFCPCRGFHSQELLQEILLDSDSVEAIVKGYNFVRTRLLGIMKSQIPSSTDLSIGASWFCI